MSLGRVCPKRVGRGPPQSGSPEGGGEERRQCRALAEACKVFGENWLYPDSHVSSQPPEALSPEFDSPRGAGGVDEGLAGSEVMASSRGAQAGGRGSKEHMFGGGRASGWEAK